MSRDFKGIWIPREIWVSKEMTMQEKVFLAEIHSLDNEQGCIASNAYFAEFFGLSKSSVTRVISSLVEKGFCKVHLIYKNNKEVDKRVIRTSKYGDKEVKVVKEVVRVEAKKSSVGLSKDDEVLIKSVLDYLNLKAERKRGFRRTPTFSKLILARVNEGHSLDDFIHVINVKCSQWLNTEWDKFLRPSTLFSLSKFPEYLSEKHIETKGDVSNRVADSQKNFYDI